MKRYAITWALIVLIAASLGTYYAYGAELRLPEYKLQTLEGDPAQATKLTLFGSYVGGKGSYPLEVTTTGSKRSDPTFRERWMRSNGPLYYQMYSDFKALYKEHSGFMRGKPNEAGYYSDEESLIYAEAEYTQSQYPLQDGVIRWNIDLKDLATGQENRYTDEQTWSARYAHVVDVQKTGAELHVLSDVTGENQDIEVIDKVFDLQTGEAIRTVTLPLDEPSSNDSNDREQQIRIITEDNPAAANSRVLFRVSDRIVEYNYVSGDLREVTLVPGADTNKQVTSTNYTLEGNWFSILQISDEAVTMNGYDLSASLEQPKVTIRANQLGKGRISQAQVSDGLVYLLLQTGDALVNNTSKPITAVADATDGRILYKGTPALHKANGRPDDQLDDAWFLNMYIKR